MLVYIGKLISTTDMKMAKRLGEVVNVSEITGGQTPQWCRQANNTLSMMFHGEYYEVAA